jgi:ribose-phosphate pyrophosphokinase
MFVNAMFWVDAFVERGGQPPALILPNVPGARQDRLNNEGDYLFTVKSVAKMINERKFPWVTILDPHSDVAPALIERCRVKHISDFFPHPLVPYDFVIAPDAGAEKRAGRVAKLLSVPLLRAWKERDLATGEITGFGMEEAPTGSGRGTALVVDDICDGGGTFNGLAPVLNKNDLDADLFVTHGIFSKGLEELGSNYRRIITTDSMLQMYQPPYLKVLPVCEKVIKGVL